MGILDGVRTFVVRIVEPATGQPPEQGEQLRGVVQVVGGDAELTFHDDAQLLALPRRRGGVSAGDGAP